MSTYQHNKTYATLALVLLLFTTKVEGMSFAVRIFQDFKLNLLAQLKAKGFEPGILFLAPPVSGSVSVRVAASSDDAEQAVSTGAVTLTSTDLELAVDVSTTQIVGMRFNSIAIPKNATITSAYIEFEVDAVLASNTASLTLQGQAADNPTTFTTTASNISSRAKTTASVAWSPPHWPTVNAKQQSPEIKTIVQEIVNRPGWASGNSMVMFVSGTGSREAESYDGEATAAPLLVVNFTYCDNVTAAGTIAGNQSSTFGFDPTNITSSVAASGGSGTLLYQWESSTNNTTFTDISGATSSTYDPPFIPVTTYYRRKATRTDCTTFLTSNTVTKTVTNPTEICNNSLDDDADGQIDCNDSDCNRITLSSLTVGACVNHPLQDVATVSLNVAWTTPPSNDSIVVSIYGKKVYVPTGSVAGNQTVSFNVPADGSANNVITAYWINSPSLCNKTTTYNAPPACSNDKINCNILYLCGQDKPYDGDSWDHGFINYLDLVNGTNSVTPILTKPDASGYGTYDPMNPSTFVNVNFSNYQLIVVSATTENYIATGLINYLKNSTLAVLNGNYTIINDLGMAAAEGSYQYQSNAYINNSTTKQIYDYFTISPYYSKVFTKADVITGGTGYLWANANNQTPNTNSIYFVYDKTDVLPGVNAGHGVRVHLGYHMNGLYVGGETGYVLPAPVETYLDPVKHFTLDGKYYLDQAILAAGAGCVQPENCSNDLDDDSDGLVDCEDTDCQATQTPIVNLSASALANGNLASWSNTGSLGGSFGNGGTTPLVETVAGRKAVTFDGTDVMTSSFNAPAGITGNSNYTVMVWAYNPTIADEEALMSWSYRGGGDGTNAHINYGANPAYGAISHWGGPDMAYATIPTAGTWNHFAITYSGGTGGIERVYVNGVLNNEEAKTLSLHANQPLHLGAARSSSTGGSTLHFSGSIASVKVYDQELTAANIAGIYAQENSTDCYELTNLSCSSICQTGNVVLNGDFSSNTTNWTAPNGGLTIDPAGPSGSFLILNNSDVASNFTVYQDVACSANQEYIFMASAARHGTTTNAKFYLEFYNGSTFISKTPDVFANMIYGGAFGYLYPVKGFTPPNTTKIRVVGFANGTALKMDNISLKLCQNCVENCNNGTDDDSDGLIDGADSDCMTFCATGTLNLERWTGISGTTVANLTSSPAYPNSPNFVGTITSFDGPDNIDENYGTRVRGYIEPTITGAYTFNLTGDDYCTLYLSTNVQPANMAMIASIVGWTNPTEYTKYASQTSSVINLVAGQKYYVELLHKEAGGGDHFQVYWQTPASNTWTIIPAANIRPFYCPEICTNNFDDDGDGLTDCADPDCNLITNGEFNSGTTGWQLHVQASNTATLGVNNSSQLSGLNSAFVDLTSVTGTEWHVQLAQSGLSIAAGQAYTVSFQAKAATNRTASVMLQRTGPPYPNYWFQPFNLTTTAQTYSYDFIVDSTNVGQVGLLFNLAANGSDVWIDKVSMTKACFTPETCGNGLDDDGDGATDNDDTECFACSSGLLSNPGFNSNLAGWTNWGNTSIIPEPNGNKYVRIAGGYGGMGIDYPATPGTTYSLRFQARADAGENAWGGISFWDASYNKLGEDFMFQVNDTTFKQFQVAAVAPPNTAFVRAFGWKNEGAGKADFDGFCLKVSTENCSNAADDDGDGLVDCNDPDCPCAIALAVGNMVFIDADNDKVFDSGEGVNGVVIRLFRVGDDPNLVSPVASTTTANGGKYLFDNLLPGNYFIHIPKTEFAVAKPLFGKVSVDGNDGDFGADDQVSENGVDNPNPVQNGIRSSNFALFYNSEPKTSGTELGFDKTSDDTNDPSDDDNTDLTIDFGFGNPDACSLTISQAKATPCYKNASGNWVTDIEVTVYWAGLIDGDTIRVSMNGKSDNFAPFADNSAAWPKGVQHFFLKEVPATGGSGTVNAQFVVRTGCSASKTVTLPDCACPAGAVSGMAWQDFNNNGIQDSHETIGVAGIGVMAYDCDGNLVGTTSTNAGGAFSFSGLTNGSKYRIEFYNVPAPYFASAIGASNGSNVQFATAPTCHVDFGVNNPDFYCEDDPMIGIPCYVNGLASAPAVANQEAFVLFPYDATASYNSSTNLIERSVYPTLGALVGQTGATWGVAYQRSSKTVFTSAVIKRHVGLGPLGTGGIYKINVSNPSAPVASNWMDVKTLGIDTGTDPRDGSPGNTLPTTTGDPSYDLNAYDAVGKKAIGDIDFDESRNTLWFVNLYERTLVGIKNVNPNAAPTISDVLEYPIAIPSGYSCGPTHEFRPWGLKVYEGKVYIGIICTNISSSWTDYTGLKAFVVSFDPNAPASGFSFVAEIDMTYDKYQYGLFKYNNWVPSYNDLSYGYGYTSPIISDIEFDTDGAMILGIADRLGLQMGYYNYAPDKNLADQTLYTVAQSGDLLRLCKVGNNYVMPGSDPSCPVLGVVHGDGANGGEYYWGDWGPKVMDQMSMDNGFNETAMGGIAMKRGSGEVVTTQTDAVVFRSGAVATYNNVTGGVTNTYTLYEGVGNGAQGKATGLGDIEVLCNYQPIEIGNYVWLDEDADGTQDACEPPLDSIVVSLYKANGILIGTTTTNTLGNYVFNETNVDTTGNLADNVWTGLSANASYIVVAGKINNNGVVFANGKMRVNGLDALLTFPNTGQGANADLNDSDGTILSGLFAAVNGFPGVVVTTPAKGSSHNADFGFRPLCQNFSVFAGTDISICTGTIADLTATGNGGLQPYSFAWSHGLGNGASQAASPTSTTTYTVTITDADGCTNLDQVMVTVTNCSESCVDGIDNDGDGLMDCDDPDCAAVGQPNLVDDEYETCPGQVFVEQPIFNDLNIQHPVYSIYSQPTKGSASINFQGVFIYTPNSSTCGIDSFTYQVCNSLTGCCDQATVTLHLGDHDPPQLQNLPADLTINCDAAIPAAPVVFGLDDCPGIFVTFNEVNNEVNAGACNDYTIVRTWSATDVCGNSTSAHQTITVKDEESPEIFRVYTLANGKKLMGGVVQKSSVDWQQVKFPTSFNVTPLVFAQIVSDNGVEAISPRIRGVNDESFELKFQEEENGDDVHVNEKIAWFALEPGALNDSTNLQAGLIANVTSNYKLLSYATPFSAVPVTIASVQSNVEFDPISIRFSNPLVTGVQLKLEEEISSDPETGHGNESVGFLATKLGNILDVNGDFVAFAGKTNLTDAWKTISFPRKFTKPVVVFGGLPVGTDPATVRVRNVTPSGFEAKIDEWDYLNGLASANNVSYVVVEGGIPAFVENPCELNPSVLIPGLNLFAVDNCDNQVSMEYTESSQLTPNGLIYTKIWISTDDCGNASTIIRSDTCNLAAVRVKVLLGGAMIGLGANDGLMRDNLRQGYFIPNTSPYVIPSSLNPGATGQGSNTSILPSLLEVSGNNAIVDWMLLEIREANDPRTVVASFPCLLQRDGDVVMANNGSDILTVAGLQEDFYYVRITHRNHLGAMTADPVYLKVGDVPLVDFTDTNTEVHGGISSLKSEGGKRRLWSGDLNSDKRVIYQGPYNDVFKLFSDVLTHPMNTTNIANFIRIGYENSDLNMDGNTIYQGPSNDRSLLLLQTVLAHPNNTILLANFMAIELLP